MKPVELKKDLFWVGTVDWTSRDFHGYSRSPKGTSYNAFLIKDEKITLVDTVKGEHTSEFLCSLAQALDGDLEKIDYIVVNHLELDHSGALREIIARAKPEKIFCSPMGKRNMETIFHGGDDWPVEVCKSGHTISIGSRTLQFIETRMLHWPDNMVTYCPEDKFMISSDAFGQNIAATNLWADEFDRPSVEHALKEYFANIVQPYSSVVIKTLDALAEMNLELDMILPDHGLLWRGEDCQWVLDQYRSFSEQKPKNKALIMYDTMWHSTEKMAHAIAAGLKEEGVPSSIMSVKRDHHSTIETELFDCGAFIVGSPTHNNGILPEVAGTLQYIKGLRPLNKVGGAFGSFGWSGECVKAITTWLEDIGVDVVEGAVKVKNVPDHEAYKQCFEYGQAIAKALKAKIEEVG